MDRLFLLFKTPVMTPSVRAASGGAAATAGGGLTYGSLFAGLFPSLEKDKFLSAEEVSEMYLRRGELSPRERLGLMWRFDRFGNSSPELREVNATGQTGLMLGFFYGGLNAGTAAFAKFKDDNKHTMFRHPREAQKLAHEQGIFHFFRGGWRIGLRVGAFSWMYLAFAHSLSVAFNRVNPLDHTVSGFALGFLWRASTGPKPALATGILGSMMGTTIGISFWLLHLIKGGEVGDRWHARLLEQAMANEQADEMLKDQRIKMGEDNLLFAKEVSDPQLDPTKGTDAVVERRSRGGGVGTKVPEDDGLERGMIDYAISRLRGTIGGGGHSPDLNPSASAIHPGEMTRTSWTSEEAAARNRRAVEKLRESERSQEKELKDGESS